MVARGGSWCLQTTALMQMLEEVLLPSVSMLGPNAAAVSELWAVIKEMPYAKRYGMYGRWNHGLHVMGNHLYLERAKKLSACVPGCPLPTPPPLLRHAQRAPAARAACLSRPYPCPWPS